MKFEIKRAENGLILSATQEESEESESFVYQEKFDDEVRGFAEFLSLINDHFGPSSSRYDRERIVVKIVFGDKYEGPEREEAAKQALDDWRRWHSPEEKMTIEEAFLAGVRWGQ